MTKIPGKKPTPPPSPPDDEARVDEPITDPRVEPIVHRPDGYYWQAPDGHNEFGPFETYQAARADLHAADIEDEEPVEALREAKDEFGIADWIDPETGEPAEGQSPPHIDPD